MRISKQILICCTAQIIPKYITSFVHGMVFNQRVWLGSKRKASQYQMDAGNSGWNFGKRYCGCKSGYSPRRCACQKAENRSVLVFVPVAIAQILPTRMQTRTISQMMMAYYSNLMAMTLDLMAYLKNNDGNALR